MNRRHFLSTTMLGTAALAAFSGRAQAFALEDCQSRSDPACREVIRHREILARLDQALTAKGLNEAEKKAVLAAATCPFCGQPLIG